MAGLVGYPEDMVNRYRSAGLWSGRTLPDELVLAARRHAAETALVTPDGRRTYRDLYDSAARLAHGVLTGTRLRTGDAVMFQMGNNADTVTAYLACLLAGLRPVCTLPQHGEREIGLLASHIGARGLFTQADFGRGLLPGVAASLLDRGLVSDVVVFRGDAFERAVAAGELPAVAQADPLTGLPFAGLALTDPAVFQLSGGTTGLPKVAPRLHEEYAYNARAWAEVMGWAPGQVVFYPLPIMHNAGITLALQSALLSGATLVLSPSASVDDMIPLIARERPVAIPLVPPAVAIRLLEAARTREVDLRSIKDFVVGGQKLAREVAVALRDELGIEVRQKFGMAEGMFLVTPDGASEEVRFTTVGRPISDLDEVRIVDPATGEDVAPGSVGELWTRGPYTIRGYFRADAHNQAAFSADGFYRTGDLAREQCIDGENFYSIEGRIKDVINRGVEKIHAEEVEELILAHPSVAQVALVAMPDPVLGERVCAYLVLAEGAAAPSVAELGTFLQQAGLAKFKLPERIEVVPALPLTNVGKVAKKLLREDIQQKLAGAAPAI